MKNIRKISTSDVKMQTSQRYAIQHTRETGSEYNESWLMLDSEKSAPDQFFLDLERNLVLINGESFPDSPEYQHSKTVLEDGNQFKASPEFEKLNIDKAVALDFTVPEIKTALRDFTIRIQNEAARKFIKRALYQSTIQTSDNIDILEDIKMDQEIDQMFHFWHQGLTSLPSMAIADSVDIMNGYAIKLNYTDKPKRIDSNKLYLYLENEQVKFTAMDSSKHIRTIDISKELGTNLGIFKEILRAKKNLDADQKVIISKIASNFGFKEQDQDRLLAPPKKIYASNIGRNQNGKPYIETMTFNVRISNQIQQDPNEVDAMKIDRLIPGSITTPAVLTDSGYKLENMEFTNSLTESITVEKPKDVTDQQENEAIKAELETFKNYFKKPDPTQSQFIKTIEQLLKDYSDNIHTTKYSSVLAIVTLTNKLVRNPNDILALSGLKSIKAEVLKARNKWSVADQQRMLFLINEAPIVASTSPLVTYLRSPGDKGRIADNAKSIKGRVTKTTNHELIRAHFSDLATNLIKNKPYKEVADSAVEAAKNNEFNTWLHLSLQLGIKDIFDENGKIQPDIYALFNTDGTLDELVKLVGIDTVKRELIIGYIEMLGTHALEKIKKAGYEETNSVYSKAKEQYDQLIATLSKPSIDKDFIKSNPLVVVDITSKALKQAIEAVRKTHTISISTKVEQTIVMGSEQECAALATKLGNFYENQVAALQNQRDLEIEKITHLCNERIREAELGSKEEKQLETIKKTNLQEIRNHFDNEFRHLADGYRKIVSDQERLFEDEYIKLANQVKSFLTEAIQTNPKLKDHYSTVWSLLQEYPSDRRKQVISEIWHLMLHSKLNSFDISVFTKKIASLNNSTLTDAVDKLLTSCVVYHSTIELRKEQNVKEENLQQQRHQETIRKQNEFEEYQKTKSIDKSEEDLQNRRLKVEEAYINFKRNEEKFIKLKNKKAANRELSPEEKSELDSLRIQLETEQQQRSEELAKIEAEVNRLTTQKKNRQYYNSINGSFNGAVTRLETLYIKQSNTTLSDEQKKDVDEQITKLENEKNDHKKDLDELTQNGVHVPQELTEEEQATLKDLESQLKFLTNAESKYLDMRSLEDQKALFKQGIVGIDKTMIDRDLMKSGSTILDGSFFPTDKAGLLTTQMLFKDRFDQLGISSLMDDSIKYHHDVYGIKYDQDVLTYIKTEYANDLMQDFNINYAKSREDIKKLQKEGIDLNYTNVIEMTKEQVGIIIEQAREKGTVPVFPTNLEKFFEIFPKDKRIKQYKKGKFVGFQYRQEAISEIKNYYLTQANITLSNYYKQPVIVISLEDVLKAKNADGIELPFTKEEYAQNDAFRKQIHFNPNQHHDHIKAIMYTPDAIEYLLNNGYSEKLPNYNKQLEMFKQAEMTTPSEQEPVSGGGSKKKMPKLKVLKKVSPFTGKSIKKTTKIELSTAKKKHDQVKPIEDSFTVPTQSYSKASQETLQTILKPQPIDEAHDIEEAQVVAKKPLSQLVIDILEHPENEDNETLLLPYEEILSKSIQQLLNDLMRDPFNDDLLFAYKMARDKSTLSLEQKKMYDHSLATMQKSDVQQDDFELSKKYFELYFSFDAYYRNKNAKEYAQFHQMMNLIYEIMLDPFNEQLNKQFKSSMDSLFAEEEVLLVGSFKDKAKEMIVHCQELVLLQDANIREYYNSVEDKIKGLEDYPQIHQLILNLIREPSVKNFATIISCINDLSIGSKEINKLNEQVKNLHVECQYIYEKRKFSASIDNLAIDNKMKAPAQSVLNRVETLKTIDSTNYQTKNLTTILQTANSVVEKVSKNHHEAPTTVTNLEKLATTANERFRWKGLSAAMVSLANSAKSFGQSLKQLASNGYSLFTKKRVEKELQTDIKQLSQAAQAEIQPKTK